MLTPEEVQSREFLVSLRGYDRDEVHAFLGRVAEQLAQTEAKAAQLQQRLDRLKGQQGQAVEAEPATVTPQAAATTSPEPSAMFAEIGKETQRILEAAQEAGQQIQRKARQEADRDLQAARSQAAKLIAEGERRREHIERVVSELEQSRASMSVQLRGIGRTIEQTLRELAPSEAASTVREAIGAEAARDADSGPSGNGGIPAEEASQAQVDAAPAAAAAPETEAPAADAPAADETLAADDAPSAGSGPSAGVPAVDAPVTEAPAAPAPPAEGENAPEEAGRPGDQPTAAAAPSQPQQTAAEEPAAAAADDEAVAPAPVATEPAMPAAAQPPVSSANGKQDPQGLRAAALSPLHPKLVRKVKRELQEIQNIALDKVRRTKGQGDVESFLPTDEDTSGLGEGAAELLEQAWRAGVESAGVLADRSIDTPDDIPDLAGVFLNEATERVRSGLSASLKMGLSADEDQQGLSDRIGSVFSDFKGAQSEELAATHLIRAYEQGLLGAWTAAGVSARGWVLGREPRCPEAKCRANEQGGPAPVGEAFASGHDVPPVHVGCTCTTIPAEASSV